MKRVLCIWLPNWPIQRLIVARPELKGKTLLLHARWGNRGERVTACSTTAQASGVHPGMPLPEATALLDKSRRPEQQTSSQDTTAQEPPSTGCPPLRIESHVPDQDRQELLHIAEWCEQFSPLVGIEDADWIPIPRGMPRSAQRPESLLLDATGTGAWFGGETHLTDKVIRDFSQRGYSVRVAIADTIGAAWGVAHGEFEMGPSGLDNENTHHLISSNSKSLIVPPDQTLPTLQLLPIEALRLPGETSDLLHQLGIFQIQQLVRLPRTSLSSRLGPWVLHRLDQATGAIKEVLVAHRAPPTFHAQCSLEYPTTKRAVIEQILQQLLEQMARQLVGQDRGAVQLEVHLTCLDADHVDVTANHQTPTKVLRLRLDLFRPLADTQHFLDLVRMQLEQTRVPGPVRQIDAQATRTALREPQQNTLFADASRIRARDLAMLVDRLSGRLGPDGVLRPRLVATAQPERAYRLIPLTQRAAHSAVSKPAAASSGDQALGPNDRPMQLCDPPLPLNVLAIAPDGPPIRFHAQSHLHQVAQFWGPERIETGWWRGRTIRRDYYRVETPTGQRFWLFRHSDEAQWFLHGTFE